MPNISKKAIDAPASPIRKLVPFADAAKFRGVNVYHLNIGQPDIKSPAEALKAVKNNSLDYVEYSHSAGILSYRKALAKYYQKHNINVNENEIIVTNAGSEALLFAFFACFNEGDEVIIPEPYYTNYNTFAVYSGVKIVPVKSSIESGFALPPISEFETIITPKTKAIMICNPGNPTGYLYTKEEIDCLGELLLKHNLFLISDEVYREFCYDNATHASAMHLCNKDARFNEHIVLLDSVSKRYSACGVRVGCFVTKNAELYNSVMKFAQARLSPPTYGQIFGEAASELTPDSYFEKVAAEYVKRRNIIIEAVNKIEGCFCPIPKGAFYVIARLPVDDTEKFCRWLLEDFSFENQTVMLTPAAGFYATEGLGKNEVRISYVLQEKDLKAAMKCLEEALKVYNK